MKLTPKFLKPESRCALKIYAVIDTNVVVSAMLKWSSVPGNILEFAFGGIITPLLNDEIVNEYRSVLMREKFHLTEEIVSNVIETLEAQGEYVDAEKIDLFFPDPKDIVFYAVTMAKLKYSPTYLVTGNIKHFPSEPCVVTPREMLDIILKLSQDN